MPGNKVDGHDAHINNPYGNQGKAPRREGAVTKSVNWQKSSALAENGLAQVTSHTQSAAQKLDKFIN